MTTPHRTRMTAEQLLLEACRDAEFADKWIYRCDDTPRFQNWQLTVYIPIPEDAPDRSPEACLREALAEPEPEPVAARCPDCIGSERPGWKRGMRCATCDGSATVATPPAAPAPAVPNDSKLADAHLAALLRYTGNFYGVAMERGLPAGQTANMVAHVESAARALHKMALSSAPVVREPRHVRKVGGSFQHTGTVVAEFKTLAGEPRIVLEFDAPVAGMLHVYRPDQVEPCEPVAPAATSAAPAVPLTEERLQRAYALGWTAAASWAKHDDLIDDIGSPAYVAEMTDALQVCGIGGGNG